MTSKRTLNLLTALLALVMTISACENPGWGKVPTIPAGSTETAIVQPSTAQADTTTPDQGGKTSAPTASVQPSSTMPAAPTATMAPEAWQSMPAVPQVSEKMVEVYKAGLAAGRDPNHFSKIGDCQNITTYFLADLDHPGDYSLGSQYAPLQATIDHFLGSWSRESLSVKGGLNVASAMNPMWANSKACNRNETPLACEIRVYNPSIAIISMEESWSGDIHKYDQYLRKIVEYVLSQNVVPILATRAEPDNAKISINETVARIAYDYQVPLWNFWAAAYPLPFHGLTADGFHLTQARSFFDDPARMEAGWPWRNLTALEAIDAVYRGVSLQP
jgi:hypothetical protein